ncbi:hypothetical protein chiPu_0015931 [Chiloscyllium punctatum]|uniref:Uncharacterized protein n=1 Tax=Chiloscyllium punctatum TaxID=137246 RepID=A0A401T488_CHIPU|nr:hypothetical protein [Chiloscyllium punctatum]
MRARRAGPVRSPARPRLSVRARTHQVRSFGGREHRRCVHAVARTCGGTHGPWRPGMLVRQEPRDQAMSAGRRTGS